MPPIQLDHIAIALPRIADAPAAPVAVLGGVPDRSQPAGAFRWATWVFAGGGCIEILEPVGPDGFLHRFQAARGRGVHHVTFKVPDLGEACRRAEARGYDVVGRDASDPSWKKAFLHPKQAQGIVVQIVGEMETTPEGSLVFRWPGSPMRLVVDVEPTAAEGPLAIELPDERPVAALEAAGARLGIRLTPRSA